MEKKLKILLGLWVLGNAVTFFINGWLFLAHNLIGLAIMFYQSWRKGELR